ncbi:hypothetical protein AB433_06805 [Croceicoccus naphthovorans]|uniref:DUF4261 domain-containing protein n=2 Tax=Croceicoccus naphthovorans TaxID=1348774 RepID=A0A0G3XDY4_9SPHN|nr:hypothetical protein AB433_06805 [Croceicoccus naphthovorans]
MPEGRGYFAKGAGAAPSIGYVLWFDGAAPDRRKLADLLALAGFDADSVSGNDSDMVVSVDGHRLLVSKASDGDWPGCDRPQSHFDIRPDLLEKGETVKIALVDDPGRGWTLESVLTASRLALAMAADEGFFAAGWVPASAAMSADYFVKVITGWLGGGAFPALGLVGMTADAGGTLVSTGLSLFCGQELTIPASSDLSGLDRARVAIRFINYLVVNGPVEHEDTIEIEGYGGFEIAPFANGSKINLKRTPIF